MDQKLYETLNRKPGLFAIAAAMIFVIIIILTFIVRIFQFPHHRQQYLISENTQSVPTRILCIIRVFNSFVDKPKHNLDLSDEFKSFQRGNNNCTFLNSTSSSMNEDNSGGGFYLLGFSKINVTSGIISNYIGDTNNEMNWNLSMPQWNKFSDVEFLISSDSGNFNFSEVSVDEPKISDQIKYPQPTTWIGLITPIHVITKNEEPPLTLTDLLSNVGGYLPSGEFSAFILVVARRTRSDLCHALYL
ncbi:unnamed protein product [Rhizophagus irregularis]|uniref:Uncharacterized protein n=1 Tax=Rhizophagus irregularis TaxID=588596 RepID=A0A915Z374_9GLOM|nr:unnamed protein product [Rhizophagus irregularis]